MRFDVRVGAVMNERHASRASHEPEGRLIGDTGLHRFVPFYGQAEPELWLCAKGATVAAIRTTTGSDCSPSRLVTRPATAATRRPKR